MRNRGNLANRGARATWRKRDTWIVLGRIAIVVVAVIGLAALGRPPAPDYSRDVPQIVRPATEVEKLTHDLQREFELDRVDPERDGWGAD